MIYRDYLLYALIIDSINNSLSEYERSSFIFAFVQGFAV